MKYELASCKPVMPAKLDFVLTVEHQPGWFLRLFGVKPRQVQYVGCPTVWCRLPDHARMGTDMEVMLNRMHQRWEWEQKQVERERLYGSRA